MPPLPFTPPLPPLRHHPLNHRLLSSPLSTRPHTHTAINSDTTEWDPSMVSPARIDPFYTPSSTAPTPTPTTTTTPTTATTTTTTKPAEGIFAVSFIDPPPPPKRKRAPAPAPMCRRPSTSPAPSSPATPPKKRRKPPPAACTAAAVAAGISAVASTITAAATNTLSAATATASTLLALATTTTAPAAAALPLIDLYRAHAQRRPHSRGMSILHTKLPYIGERALLDLDFAGSEADGVMGAAEMRALVDAGEGSGEWARLESVVRDREVGGVCRRVVRFVEWS